ncbi:MAG: vpr [Ilumatobacteraceae bacterium]|nr:vpr [Ilumatobacteraceae bacterium]
MRGRRSLGAVALAAVVTATFATSTSSAQAPPVDGSAAAKLALATAGRTIAAKDITWHPAAGDPNRIIKVIVQVKGASVAEAKGDAVDAGTQLTDAKSAAVATAAAATQDSVTRTVASHGGTVRDRHVNAINSMTVSLPAGSVAALQADPDVESVSPLKTFTRDNGTSNAFTGVPVAWQNYGATGAGQKIAILDTGIDYTHADFGGSGDPADFAADDPTIIEPGTFPTAKVVGGTDLVGDDYDASSTDPAKLVPHPDPDPIGCADGGAHGTHVAGTAAGDGVLLDGSTFHGPYDTTIDPAKFAVSPGSAPEASLLAYRVFGCAGSVDSDIIVAAIDQAVADGADVINMSLGGDIGTANDPETVAVDNAVRAGVVVVASAGNPGQAAYLVGSPSTANRALSVGAVDAHATLPGGEISDGTRTIDAINANNGPLPVTGTIVVVPDGSGGISLGCDAADYPPPTTPSTIYVTLRGDCARVDRATLGQAAGGQAVIMVNTSTDFPPFEGVIPGVTIPFLGVSSASAHTLLAMNGTAVTITPSELTNPGYTRAASFTAGGPRSGDAGQKPDVTAPGVSVFSAGIGTGTGGIVESGTSMSSPHTAGIAAIVKQEHPTWSAEMIKAAIVDTANAAAVGDFDTRIDGNGLVNPVGAIATDTLLMSPGGTTAVNFGIQELTGAYTDVKPLKLRNTGDTAATYNLAPVWNSETLGAAVSVSPRRVTVAPHSTTDVEVKISIPKAAVTALPVAGQGSDVVTTLRGQIVATPTTAHDQVLSLPFIMAPHGRSDVEVTKSAILKVGWRGTKSGTVVLKNYGVHAGTADVYNWLLSDSRDRDHSADSRAMGVQYFVDADPAGHPGQTLIVLAFSVFGRASSPSQNYYDVIVDADHDGAPDHEIVVVDSGAFSAGAANGVMGTFVIDLATKSAVAYGADAATDGSVALGVLWSGDLGITPTSGPAVLQAQTVSYSYDGLADLFDGVATINPLDPQASSGDFIPMDPKDSASFGVTARTPLAGEVPVKGWMVVTMDDTSGTSQADLIRG